MAPYSKQTKKNEIVREEEIIPEGLVPEDTVPDLHFLFNNINRNFTEERQSKKRRRDEMKEAIEELFREYKKNMETLHLEGGLKKMKLTS